MFPLFPLFAGWGAARHDLQRFARARVRTAGGAIPNWAPDCYARGLPGERYPDLAGRLLRAAGAPRIGFQIATRERLGERTRIWVPDCYARERLGARRPDLLQRLLRARKAGTPVCKFCTYLFMGLHKMVVPLARVRSGSCVQILHIRHLVRGKPVVITPPRIGRKIANAMFAPTFPNLVRDC